MAINNYKYLFNDKFHTNKKGDK